jgi:hypothetical protein
MRQANSARQLSNKTKNFKLRDVQKQQIFVVFLFYLEKKI